MKKYPSFKELKHLIARHNSVMQAIDSQLLTADGKMLKEMYATLNSAFSEAYTLEDALSRISISIDETVDRMDIAVFDRRYLRSLVKQTRIFVKTQVPADIWRDFPVLVNPYS